MQRKRKGNVIGSPITIGSVASLASEIIADCQDGRTGYVCVANVHMVTTAYRDDELKQVIGDALQVTADGLPLVWSLRQQGFRNAQRVTGTDLTLHLCELAAASNIPVGFYGAANETLKALHANIIRKFPDLDVRFLESPPALPVQPPLDPSVVALINKSGAKIVFVALGCPKQEFWMATHSPHVTAILIGVGAAFNFIAGTVKRAPQWMQNIGCEWLHRLISEPGRTWKRYATTNPLFLFYHLKEALTPRKMQ